VKPENLERLRAQIQSRFDSMLKGVKKPEETFDSKAQRLIEAAMKGR
jgi:hypothetical protein